MVSMMLRSFSSREIQSQIVIVAHEYQTACKPVGLSATTTHPNSDALPTLAIFTAGSPVA